MFQNKNEDPAYCCRLETTSSTTEHITHHHFKETYYSCENETKQRHETRKDKIK